MSQYGDLLNEVVSQLTGQPGLQSFTVVRRRKPRLAPSETGPFCIVSGTVESVDTDVFGSGDGQRPVQISYPVQVTLVLDAERFLESDADLLLDAREAVRRALYNPALFGASDVTWDPNPLFDASGLSVSYDASAQLFTYVLSDEAT